MSQTEKNVVIDSISTEDAHSIAVSTNGQAIGVSEDAVIKFKEVHDYTTFLCQYAIKDDDLIFQFFVTNEMKANNGPELKTYWLESFPLELNLVAKEFFNADKPRLTAKYTEELASWWFKAQKFAIRIDPEGFAEEFLMALDAALDKRLPVFDS